MRIKSVRIENFRTFKDQTVQFDDYTCLVGPNGAGKSTVLCALNIFFRENTGSSTDLLNLQDEDFHNLDSAQPVIITVAFDQLSQEAQKDFSDYCRQNELIISAVATFDPNSKCASVKQYGQRKGIPQFKSFFEAEKGKSTVEQLKQIYTELQATHPDLPPPGTKARMIEALRTYEENHPELSEPIRSEDQFYGFSKGANRLSRYVQWVFVPAVKDASTEQGEAKDTALGQLLARTVRNRIDFGEQLGSIRAETRTRYQEMLDQHQNTLERLSHSLKSRLSQWAHPDAQLNVRWQQDPERSVRVDEPFAQITVGEGQFTGKLGRFGHGLQRAYLLALLQELSGGGNTDGPTLILAIEEPELYQHPPQCRHMAQVLQDLSTTNAQIVVTTHSPYFVSGRAFEKVRMVRKDGLSSTTTINQLSLEELGRKLAVARGNEPPRVTEGTLAKIHQALQPSLNEIFFAPFLVLTEGREDIAYIMTYLTMMDRADDIRRAGCHFVSTDGKSTMIVPFAIASHMDIPVFVIFDSDGHRPDKNGSREKHRKDNLSLLRLAGVETPDPFPSDNIWVPRVVMWKSEIAEVIAADFEPAAWNRHKEEGYTKFGQVEGLAKNPLFISEVLHSAWNEGLQSETLVKLCENILTFCGGRTSS